MLPALASMAVLLWAGLFTSSYMCFEDSYSSQRTISQLVGGSSLCELSKLYRSPNVQRCPTQHSKPHFLIILYSFSYLFSRMYPKLKSGGSHRIKKHNKVQPG